MLFRCTASVTGVHPGISVFSPAYERVDWGKAAFVMVRAVKVAKAFCAGFPGHRSSCLLTLCYTHSRVTTFILGGHAEQGSALSPPGHIRGLHHSLTFLGQCSPQKVSLGYSI